MADGDTRLTRRLRPLLGTYVEIGVSASSAADESIDAAYQAIGEVHRSLSFHDPDSELSRLNRAGSEGLRMSSLARRVLGLAHALGVRSNDRFNCTVAGTLVRDGDLPDHGGDSLLMIGTASDIQFDGDRVRLRRPVRVTLDGIAKGYAVDLAVATLLRSGIESGWVNAGGDMKAFGDLTLPVSVRGRDGIVQSLGGLNNAALATSQAHASDDSRFPARIVAGEDLVTCGSWSITARSAWRADALTKVAAVAPPAERVNIIEQLGGRLTEVSLESH